LFNLDICKWGYDCSSPGTKSEGHRSRSKVWVSVSKGGIAVSLTSIFEISSLTFYDNDRLYSKSVKHRARCLSVSTVS